MIAMPVSAVSSVTKTLESLQVSLDWVENEESRLRMWRKRTNKNVE